MIVNRFSKMIRFFRWTRNIRLLCVLLIVSMAPVPAMAGAFEILLGTGQRDSFSHFSGRLICRMINNRVDNLTCKTVPSSEGDVHNLTNLRSGYLDICLADSRMIQDALNQEGAFKFMDIRYENLRVLTPLYDRPIILAVGENAGIEELEDMKGKRINVGSMLSEKRRAMDTIMKAKNWSEADFSLVQELPNSQAQESMSFCHGSAQAIVHIGVHPNAVLQRLFDICGARLIGVYDSDIEKWIHAHPAFIKTEVDISDYPAHSGTIMTMGTRAMLVTSDILDENNAMRILDAIHGGRQLMKRAHEALSVPDPDKAGFAAGLPLHAGAEKYFSGKLEQTKP